VRTAASAVLRGSRWRYCRSRIVLLQSVEATQVARRFSADPKLPFVINGNLRHNIGRVTTLQGVQTLEFAGSLSLAENAKTSLSSASSQLMVSAASS
jgi:hypothetical protein